MGLRVEGVAKKVFGDSPAGMDGRRRARRVRFVVGSGEEVEEVGPDWDLGCLLLMVWAEVLEVWRSNRLVVVEAIAGSCGRVWERMTLCKVLRLCG